MGDTQHEHGDGEYGRQRDTGDSQADPPPQHGLNDGGQHHAERDRANGLRGQQNRGIAALRPQANGEMPYRYPHALAAQIQQYAE